MGISRYTHRMKSRLIRSFLLLVVAVCLLAKGDDAAADKNKLLESADRIAKKVSALRGLALKQPIKRAVMNKEQILKRLKLRIDSEYSAAEIEGESWILKRFGLLPPDLDYMATVLGLLTEQVAGFYDPFERHLYIADWVTLGGDFVMSHEIDHALQDQHFNLKKFLTDVKHDADAALARQALVEGDGMATSVEYMMDVGGRQAPWGQSGFTDQFVGGVRGGVSELKGVPLALREALLFPYASGLAFVAHYRKHHPWSKVDAIFDRPPLSTEHILHPEKYQSYEPPQRVAMLNLPALSSYRRLHNNTVGEFSLRLFLKQHGLAEEKAARAVAGWGGDRWALFAPKGHKGKELKGLIGVLYTAWDTDFDAIEFMEALKPALEKLSGGSSLRSTKKVLRFKGKDGTMFVAEIRNKSVVVLAGPTAAQDAKIRKQVWAKWGVGQKKRKLGKRK